MGYRQTRHQGDGVAQDRAFVGLGQRVNQWDQNHESHFEEDGDRYQETRESQGPGGATHSEGFDQGMSQSLRSPGGLQHLTEHGPQTHHHGDVSQDIPHTGLSRLQHLLKRHAGGQTDTHAHQEKSHKGVKADDHHQEDER